MRKRFVKFHNVTFAYDSASTALFQNVSLHIEHGWAGIAGANGAGKTTLLKLATGILKPVGGRIETTENSLYCPQRTDEFFRSPPAHPFVLFQTLQDDPAEAFRNPRIQRMGGMRPLLLLFHGDAQRRIPGKRTPARRHLIQDDTQGIDIGPVVDLSTYGLFR